MPSVAIPALLVTVLSAIFSADGRSHKNKSFADPWLDPYLPTNVEPVSYDIWLHPDFYFDGSTFQGRESIVLDILSTTNTIIVHKKVCIWLIEFTEHLLSSKLVFCLKRN